MALASDQKIRLNGAAFKHQDLIERCLKGTPNIKLDLQRLNTLASLGLPRRVPCVEAEDNISEDTDGKKVSPCLQEEFTGKNQSSISPRNGLASIDSAEVRKRKADRDVSNSRERVQPKQVEGRFNPHLRANLDLPAELKNRKAIEQAKELFNIQDKENINPRNDLRRRDLRKQATDRSAEKRRLQVSSKLQNAQTGRKVGSLLVKHSIGRAKPSARPPVPSQDREKQVSQQASLDFTVSSKTEDPMNQIGQAKLSVLDAGHPPLLSQDREKQVSHQANLDFMVSSKPEDPMNHTGQAKLSVLDAEHPPLLSQDSEKQVSQQSSLDLMGSLKTGDPVNIMQLSPVRMASPMQHTGNDDRSNSSDSMSISQPLQFNSRGVQVQYKEVAQSTSSLVDGSHRAVMAASVSDLSSSMSTLAISDSNCPEFMHLPPVPEKFELEEEMKNAYRPSILDAKQSASVAQVGAASAACPILPALSAHFVSTSACSITMRTTSAPLATSVSSSQQSIAGNCELSRKSIPSLNNLQPPSKHVPSPASEALMSSQANPVLPTSSTDQGNAFLKEEERQCSAKTGHSANGVLKTGQDRASPEEVALSEAGPAKLISHLHAKNVPDRKATNGIDPNVQQRKQIENDHFVWVNGKRYQKLKKIGRGGSSEVYKVVDRDCNIYALKRIKLKGRDYGTACGFYQEIEYLNKLRDKAYIIRLIDHEVTDKTLFCDDVDRSQIIRDDICIYMVLEYGEIDLANMLEDKFKERSQGINDLDETWLRFYWRQILEAVNTIHEERIVHSDLKPANFLLAKGVLKLIDFGIAKSIQSDTTNIERDAQVGTLNYMSPEAFLMNERDEHGNIIKCGRPSDIWSLGCILYQMVYGKTPFAHITKLHAKIQEVANPNHKINYPPLANPHLLDIMKKCLAWRREDRLKIPQLLNHPFLQPHLANHDCREDIKKGITIQIPEEYSQDPELKMLTEQLVKRLTLLRHP